MPWFVTDRVAPAAWRLLCDSRMKNANRLVVCGDWAIAHGDVEGLGQIAHELAANATGALRGDLLEVARLCHRNEDLAVRRWFEIHAQLNARP